jgi:hypothetical protein
MNASIVAGRRPAPRRAPKERVAAANVSSPPRQTVQRTPRCSAAAPAVEIAQGSMPTTIIV